MSDLQQHSLAQTLGIATNFGTKNIKHFYDKGAMKTTFHICNKNYVTHNLLIFSRC